MTFPEFPRVIYKRNPLREVICQLRYPPILRIEQQKPVTFQEQIRHRYPLYSEHNPSPIGEDLPPGIAKLVQEHFGGAGSLLIHNFRTEDEIWKVGLAKDFLSLLTSRYHTWDEFKENFAEPCRALYDEYAPSFIHRVGLRYRDVIQRSLLGLQKSPWSKLINAPFAGELADEMLGDKVKQAERRVRLPLPENLGFVQIHHGLTQIEGDGGDKEECFLLDYDFYTEQKTELSDANQRLDQFNRLARSLFRHCITTELHHAMEPKQA